MHVVPVHYYILYTYIFICTVHMVSEAVRCDL